MRGRSFLFFALGVLVAGAYGRARVVVPENGFISLNVPLDPWRIGALTTRTTHPHVLLRFNRMLTQLGIPQQLENPYQVLTKGQMLGQCANQDLLWEGLATTVSCSHPKNVRRFSSQAQADHCGTCWPCLIRRAAIAHAFPSKADPTKYVTVALAHLPTDTGKAGQTVRSFQYGLNLLRLSDDQLRWKLSAVAPLADVEDKIPALVACVRSGFREVANLLGLPVP